MARSSRLNSANSVPSQPLSVILDTSVLRGTALSPPSAELSLLIKHQKSGRLRLLVPEMVAREWLSHKVEDDRKRLAEAKSAIASLRGARSLVCLEVVAELLRAADSCSVHTEDIGGHCDSWYRTMLRDLGIEIVPMNERDLFFAVDLYATGRPPYKSVRSRDDIPDALILSSVLRTCADHSTTLFVCKDARLMAAALGQGVTAVSTLADALRSEGIRSLHQNVDFAIWWENHLFQVASAWKSTSSVLTPMLKEHLTDSIAGITIHDSSIPEDNHEATVWSVGELMDCDAHWEDAESLGEGLLSLPVSIVIPILVHFQIFRGNVFTAPDWVTVSMSDYGGAHYYDASGERQAKFHARVVLAFSEQIMQHESNLAEAVTDAGVGDIPITIEDVEFQSFID